MENSIEEDIILLEKMKKNCFIKRKYIDIEAEKKGNAIEHILSDYKRVLKENEELKDRWNKDTHKLQNDLDIANAKIIELLKENEELKYKYDKALTDVVGGVNLDNSYIQVKNKIKKEEFWKFKNNKLIENKMCDFLESEERRC